jgi:hypothetical protein
MRFHQTLQLEKQKSDQEKQQEEKEMALKPIRQIINAQYQSARVGLINQAWFDPLNCSLSRIDTIPKIHKSRSFTDEVKPRPTTGTKASFSLYSSSGFSNSSLHN